MEIVYTLEKNFTGSDAVSSEGVNDGHLLQCRHGHEKRTS